MFGFSKKEAGCFDSNWQDLGTLTVCTFKNTEVSGSLDQKFKSFLKVLQSLLKVVVVSSDNR